MMSRDKELASRRSTFRGGSGILLADDRVWNLPAPAAVVRTAEAENAARYSELLRAVREADGESDRGLAELALAIFLLGLNYDLSAADLQDLLAFEPESAALHDWRRNLSEIVASHLEFSRRPSARSDPEMFHHGGPRLFSRWLAWLRVPSPVRR